MAFFQEQQSGWGAPARQASWEQQQQAPPSRSGANSATAREDALAFHSQIDEVDRAIDNLVKSGKFPFMAQNRRDSMPMGAARPLADFDPRNGPRHHSVTDFESGRQGGNVQGFYQNQRFGPRAEADSMMQAKRRMAAQRERELRNYHQEQQYNRSTQQQQQHPPPQKSATAQTLTAAGVLADAPGGKSDRSYSPNTMNEDERRELIARQHRALYGDNSSLYSGDGSASRPISQDARINSTLGGRGASPLAFDQFGMQGIGPGDSSAVSMPSREHHHQQSQQQQQQQQSGAGKEQQGGAGAERENSTTSPSSNPNAPSSFGMFDSAREQQQQQQQQQQHSSRTSNSSPTGASSPQGQPQKAGVAPIGTRPGPPGQAGPNNQALNKRSTTPLPSPLSYGFSASEHQHQHQHQQHQGGGGGAADRTGSAASNPTAADKGVGLGAWGSNSGVWGNASGKLGVQASVWG